MSGMSVRPVELAWDMMETRIRSDAFARSRRHCDAIDARLGAVPVLGRHGTARSMIWAHLQAGGHLPGFAGMEDRRP